MSAEPLLVMIHHNRPDLTRLALASLKAHTPRPYELMLINNASPDRLEGLGVDTLLKNPAPRSFAANCNLGLARAQGRPVVLLNNDLFFPPNWLAGLMAGLDAGWAVAGAVSNYELPLDLPTPDDARLKIGPQAEPADAGGRWGFLGEILGRYNQNAQARPVQARPFVSFYAVALAADAVAGLGPLCEDYVQGCEDLDWCLTAWARGLSVGQAAGAYVVHFSGRSTEADAAALMRRDAHNLPVFFQRWPLARRRRLEAIWAGVGLTGQGAQLWRRLERRRDWLERCAA
ncbi:MAG: glycosyltransferase [Pseudomonadota bacterium]